MILILRLSLSKLWISWQFYGINFLVFSIDVSFHQLGVELSMHFTILESFNIINKSNTKSFISLHQQCNISSLRFLLLLLFSIYLTRNYISELHISLGSCIRG
uniref:Callose synthase 9 n=1 Tax=Rhizophora mucronata TaxID=61149 RepID=A0A2P2MBK0_RHIMU